MRKLKSKDNMSCATRAKHLAKRKGKRQNDTEIVAFFECCKKWNEAQRGRGVGSGEQDTSPLNLEDVLVRSNFPESWMFIELETG